MNLLRNAHNCNSSARDATPTALITATVSVEGHPELTASETFPVAIVK